MTRLLRALGALVALAALLLLVPAALAHYVGRVWPAHVPPLEAMWRDVRSGNIGDVFVVKALALVVWIAWVRLATSVVVDVAARAMRRQAPRLSVLGSSQRFAAALVAAVVLMAAHPHAASARGVGSREAMPRTIPSTLLVSAPTHLPPPALQTGDEPPLPGATDTTVATREHVVRRYESYWSIAEEALGDGSRWREIVALNAGRVVAPGEVFDGTPGRLLPGWSLLVPVDPGTVPADATPSVVVERGETLSSIAADELGDPARWDELWEANRGRELGGRVFDDPNLILTGWELIVPSAFGLTPPAGAGAAAGPPAAEPSAGEPAGAPAQPGSALDPPAGVVPPAAAAGEPGAEAQAGSALDPPVGVSSAGEPSVAAAGAPAQPGSALDPPAGAPPAGPPPQVVDSATPAAGDRPVGRHAHPVPMIDAGTPTQPVIGRPLPAPAMPAVAGPGAPPSAPGPLITPPSPTVDVVDTIAATVDDGSATSVTLGGLGAAVLLAGGVITAVDMSRRRRLRAAEVHDRLSASAAAASAPMEVELRRLNAGERVARVEVVVRALAHQLLESSPGARVLGVLLGADGELDALLSRSCRAAPAPWVAVSEHRWRLAASVGLGELAAFARRADQPCPAMAHIGATMLDGDRPAELFIDLEAIGLLSVGGPHAAAVSIVRAIAAGVAMSPMAEIAHTILVGIEPAVLGHPLMQMANTLDEAVDLAAGAIGATAAVATRGLTTFELRARQHGGEAWEPAIVFAADHAGSPPADELLRLTDLGGRGLSIVVAADIESAWWKLRPVDGMWRLDPLGIDVVPVGVSAADLGRVQALINSSAAPLVADRVPDDRAASTATPVEAELPWELMVRLLGPVDVVDREERRAEFERGKALELVVWLTQHRRRSTRTGARTALWESNVRDATFANVVSDARRNLARLVAPPHGTEWIGRTLTEDLPIHPSVVTDADVLANRLQASRNLRSERAIAVLRPALELIRDMPFAGTNYLWPDAEGITSQITLTATSAAAVLAGHYLATGDTDGVFWATGQGLKVLPGHEELISLRMRAHGRHGDLAGVRLEWESYERVLHAETWSDGEPSPKLVALRRELLSLR